MKTAMNFRFSDAARKELTQLSLKLHISKTDVLEEALHLFSKKHLKEKAKLIKLAGILSREDAEEWQREIYESRTNKNKDYKL